MQMQVLIVEENPDLGLVWQRHLERHGMSVTLSSGQASALKHLHDHAVDLVILDLDLHDALSISVADYVSYRYPAASVIFVNNTSFFSDGSIFQHVQNARAMVHKDVNPEDLVAMIEHYGRGPTL